MRLVYIQADPWKVIDVDQQFNLPETICVVKGDIGHQPSQPADAMEFSPDKIRSVQILSRELQETTKEGKDFKTTLGSFIIQYEHCIASTTVRSSFIKLWCDKNKMTREYQVKGSQDTVFYAEKELGRTKIYKFEFHQHASRKLTKSLVYEMNSRLVALDINSSYDILEE